MWSIKIKVPRIDISREASMHRIARNLIVASIQIKVLLHPLRAITLSSMSSFPESLQK